MGPGDPAGLLTVPGAPGPCAPSAACTIRHRLLRDESLCGVVALLLLWPPPPKPAQPRMALCSCGMVRVFHVKCKRLNMHANCSAHE